MARSTGRTRWVFAALAVIGVVGLTTWLAWRDGDRSRAARVASDAAASAPQIVVDAPATVTAAAEEPRTPVSAPAAAIDAQAESQRDAARRRDSPPELIDFWLRVVDASNGAPIVGASVSVASTSWGSNPLHP